MSSTNAARVTFAPKKGGFYDDVRGRVRAHFEETGKSEGATVGMYVKTAFWVSATLASYAIVVLLEPPAWTALAIICFGGFCVAGIGFNVGHDAIHGAYSKNKGINWVLSWSFDVLGASSDNWRVAHNFQHHSYTNIPGSDGDIEPGPFLCLYPRPDDVKPYHRYQYLYAWFLYAWAALNWVHILDWVELVARDPRTGKRRSARSAARLLFGKVSHVTFFMLVPLVITSYAWWQIAIAYLASSMVCGFTLAIVFQMAHVVTGTSFPRATEDGRIDRSWAEHQMHTTANFSGDSWFATFICGGLEHQIEHHLFPRICHVHYRELGPIVKQCAADHGLPYHENPTFLGAVRSHITQLKRCGTREGALAALTPPEAPTPLAAAPAGFSNEPLVANSHG